MCERNFITETKEEGEKTDRQTDRHRDTETETDKQTHRHTDTQTEKRPKEGRKKECCVYTHFPYCLVYIVVYVQADC